jgi:hypothetical protein
VEWWMPLLDLIHAQDNMGSVLSVDMGLDLVRSGNSEGYSHCYSRLACLVSTRFAQRAALATPAVQ